MQKSLKKTLTRKAARAFQTRWEIVNAAERAELRTTPLNRKLHQLAALMALVQPLGWTEALAAEEAKVRARWKAASGPQREPESDIADMPEYQYRNVSSVQSGLNPQF